VKWYDDAKAVARFRRKRGKPSETRDAFRCLPARPASNTELEGRLANPSERLDHR